MRWRQQLQLLPPLRHCGFKLLNRLSNWVSVCSLPESPGKSLRHDCVQLPEKEMRDSGRIRELDGLRGVSIALVLVYHYFVLDLETVVESPLAYVQRYLQITFAGVDV